ncbi:MarR family transcriptional regulator [Streptococcus panodentis]|uniref:MarR family transcriptional regulator n=1 Tax=Streptococcus panodentis TaxID=1581472 RepID=A0ABS5AZ79_9STRE|nr:MULTISPECIES: MarR family transcriptional regulator [Streptococcus]KXT84089.1 hypothetical protein STRDD11_01135 [Streptococcus sp. DD11]MBP2621879.1 MarR family transcriptional regulator [Streptococcus panodentis]
MDKEGSQKLSELSQVFTGLDFPQNQALILSFLIVEGRGKVTFKRMINELALSKASASLALRALEEKKLLYNQKQEGSRERKIILHLYGIVDYLMQRMQVLQGMRVLFEQAALWHQEDAQYAQEFSDVADLYAKLDQAVMAIAAEFSGGIANEKE